ncbi:unnamed protein product [Paramecium sonneborni]|uniref:Uncharacterized protein n=1 Tax=Paramecium sonneborni TaxID=65129 RepID=A0A8S1PGX2_9CILI|nr:unnamed protein product [Paramecium sonneborni]
MQAQVQKSQQQQQAQTQYFVYQDLQNIINLLYSLQAVNKFFKDQGQDDHPMIKLSRNKVILQLNLSNAIHYDLLSQEESLKILKQAKIEALSILTQLEPELKEFENFIKIYKENCFSSKIVLNPQNLEKTELEANFNQNVLSKILSSIQSVDQEIKALQQSDYKVPDAKEVKKKANEYKKLTIQSLQNNFQNDQNKLQQQYLNQNNNNKNQKGDQENLFYIFIEQIEKKDIFKQNQVELYENLIILLKNQNLLQKCDQFDEAEIKFTLDLYNKNKMRENHEVYYKYFLFEKFMQFSQQKVFNNNEKINIEEFTKYQQEKYQKEIYSQKKSQIIKKSHIIFLKYLNNKKELKSRINYQDYIDYINYLQKEIKGNRQKGGINSQIKNIVNLIKLFYLTLSLQVKQIFTKWQIKLFSKSYFEYK